jgi:DNA-binding response OmpR family regulator
VALGTLERPRVHSLPTSFVPPRLGALGKVIILAREEVVAALLGLMVELQGLQPKFLGRAEPVEDAIIREKPEAVIIDCDHPDYGDALLETMKKAGTVPILFSPFRMHTDVQSVAARHGIRSFTLPTDTDTFSRVLEN